MVATTNPTVAASAAAEHADPTGKLCVIYDPTREAGMVTWGTSRSVRTFYGAWQEEVADPTGKKHPRIHTTAFLPGSNWVEIATWEKLKAQPAIQRRIKEGSFRVISPKTISSHESTAEYTVIEAKDIIANVWLDSELLRLREYDSRADVRKAIADRQKQLAEMRTAA